MLQDSLAVALSVNVQEQTRVDHVLVDHAHVTGKELLVRQDFLVKVFTKDVLLEVGKKWQGLLDIELKAIERFSCHLPSTKVLTFV